MTTDFHSIANALHDITPLLSKLAKSRYSFAGWLVTPLSVILFKYIPVFGDIQLGKYIELFWTDACLGWFTFYYLGLILGNRIIERKFKIRNLAVLYCASLLLQMAEGSLWITVYPIGCGSQLKLTSILCNSIFMLIIYTVLVNRNHEPKCRLLGIIGDYSFGIYLTHMIILKGLEPLESYKSIPYPITSIIILAICFIFCYICVSVLGKKAGRWLGFV